jgi:hypothetical protein
MTERGLKTGTIVTRNPISSHFFLDILLLRPYNRNLF